MPARRRAAAAAQAAARASLEQAALVTAEVAPEGMVRGTGRVAVACRANVRLVAAPAGSTVAERAATARVFVEADKADDGAGQCRTQLGADLAGRLAGASLVGRGHRRDAAICAASPSTPTSSNPPPSRSWSRACAGWAPSPRPS